MKFYVSVAFRETKEAIEIARAADDLGYAGIGIPDHVVNLETLATPYPYTRDGERRWEPFTEWPDPWVLVGAIAQVTTRLKFVTTVYIPAMRDPYAAAKAIGTAAYISDGRVELGIGVGWCEEEFALMGQKFERRGKRTDEMLELFRA
ncbi:MAG TPA: LLM class flavin-dependent oxidoreductase, partial [Mycobacterium sp.]|nr:LLM class flavin-dependent oxidoreductase [Mycobacterium sp.]